VYSKIVLIGNLGGDPEMRYTPGGVAVCDFSVATSTRISKETNPDCPDGWKESYNGNAWELTTWWKVTVWRKLAELCNQYLAKGRTVYIEGEAKGEAVNGTQHPRVWVGKDSMSHASFEMTGRLVKFLGGRGDNGGSHSEDEQEPPPGFVGGDDSIPF